LLRGIRLPIKKAASRKLPFDNLREARFRPHVGGYFCAEVWSDVTMPFKQMSLIV